MLVTLRWLQARADNMAAALLAAMFLAFLLQIASRYVFNYPLGWTQEICVTTWLWLVFWGSAFSVHEHEEVKFDVLYRAVSRRSQRTFALVSAAALFGGFAASFPASLDYIMFYKIKRSTLLGIRLDIVFSVYAVFAAAVIVRSVIRFVRIARGGAFDDARGEAPTA